MKTRIADVKRDNLRLVYKLPDMGLGKHGDRLGGPVRNHNHLRHLSNMSSASQASASSGSCLSSLSHIPSPSSSSSHAHSEHTSHHKSQLSYSSTASSTVYTPNNNTRDPVLLRSSNNPQPSDFLFDRDSATAYREYSVIKVNSRGKKESRTMGVDTHTIYNKIGRQDSKGNSSNNRRHPHHLHATTNNISSNSGGGGSVGGDNDGNNLSRSISSTLTQAASVKDKLFQGIQSKLIKRRERPIASVKQCVMLDAQAHGGNPALEITYQDAKGSPDVRVYLCETAFVCAEIVAKIRYLAGLR